MTSLSLFNAIPVGAIEFFDTNNKPWLKRADEGRYVGIGKVSDSFKTFPS